MAISEFAPGSGIHVRWIKSGIMRLLPTIGIFGLASYASYVGITWVRYGKHKTPDSTDGDVLLDRFMPVYDVEERHSVPIAAPAERAFEAACSLEMESSLLVSALFRCRELLLGAQGTKRTLPEGLLPQMKAIGWTVLAEVPDRETVFGIAAQPWEANGNFHPLSPAEFLGFHDPNYVKIVWTLRVDPIKPATSIFRTETRAVACGPLARSKFRTYWAFLSPGVKIIRVALLRAVKREAERERQPAQVLKSLQQRWPS